MSDSTGAIMLGGHRCTLLDKDQMPDERACHVFAIGSKGIPASYGGFESFMDSLTAYRKSTDLVYHVARLAKDVHRFLYHDAICYDVKVPEIGPAKSIYYDIAALKKAIEFCERNSIQNPVFFIMTCRIGPVMGHYAKRIKSIHGKLIINPDGHEWMRRKWSWPVRLYWRLSEHQMVPRADLLTCDSVNIEAYIRTTYSKNHVRTVYIPYGAVVVEKNDSDEIGTKYRNWLAKNRLRADCYYLVVARCVPENNFDLIIREFMTSDTSKQLAIITTAGKKFLRNMEKKYHFSKDPRIRFLDAVYDRKLLTEIRCHAYAYIHGHEVGGTNPSLLEAMGCTDVSLLLDVCFNSEVARDNALYWTKNPGSLRKTIHLVEKMTDAERNALGEGAKNRIRSAYSWDMVVRKYENVFLGRAET